MSVVNALSMEELAVLAAVNEPMSLLEAANRADRIFPGTRFDHRVALATIDKLVGRMFLHRHGIVVEPTRRGLSEAEDALEVIRELERSLRNINPLRVRW